MMRLNTSKEIFFISSVWTKNYPIATTHTQNDFDGHNRISKITFSQFHAVSVTRQTYKKIFCYITSWKAGKILFYISLRGEFFFSCSVTRRKFYLACKNHWLLKFIKTFLQCLPFWFLKWDEESFLINAECMELFVGCCGWYWEVLGKKNLIVCP